MEKLIKDFIVNVKKYNKYILMFNLLPIYPLDGGRLLKIVCDKIFTYKNSKIVI